MGYYEGGNPPRLASSQAMWERIELSKRRKKRKPAPPTEEETLIDYLKSIRRKSV